MSLYLIALKMFIFRYLVPVATIGLITFLVIKLNSIEKKVINLEKLLNEMNNHKMQ